MDYATQHATLTTRRLFLGGGLAIILYHRVSAGNLLLALERVMEIPIVAEKRSLCDGALIVLHFPSFDAYGLDISRT
jgi:hypothetical protein